MSTRDISCMRYKCRWKRTTVFTMLTDYGYILSASDKDGLGPITCDIVGDWIYHQLHPDVVDPLAHRKCPEFVANLRMRPEKKDWYKIFENK